VGCGTGRLIEILENNGYLVTGLDLNQEILDIARSRCSGKLIKQDIREIQLDINYDALICLGRTFAYMLTDSDADQAIKSFNKVLQKGGLLIMDSFDADVSRRYNFGEVREDSFEFEDMKIIRCSKSFDYNLSDSTWMRARDESSSKNSYSYLFLLNYRKFKHIQRTRIPGLASFISCNMFYFMV
jgi:ubiquinone/menaquinone biosynthesis C-methylase UbiE